MRFVMFVVFIYVRVTPNTLWNRKRIISELIFGLNIYKTPTYRAFTVFGSNFTWDVTTDNRMLMQ